MKQSLESIPECLLKHLVEPIRFTSAAIVEEAAHNLMNNLLIRLQFYRERPLILTTQNCKQPVGGYLGYLLGERVVVCILLILILLFSALCLAAYHYGIS